MSNQGLAILLIQPDGVCSILTTHALSDAKTGKIGSPAFPDDFTSSRTGKCASQITPHGAEQNIDTAIVLTRTHSEDEPQPIRGVFSEKHRTEYVVGQS
jgi:hypothetical protein